MPGGGAFPAGGHFLPGGIWCPIWAHNIKVCACPPGPYLHPQMPGQFQSANVLPDRPLAQSSALAEAGIGRVAAPVIIGVVRQREHNQTLGRAECLALENGRHDAYAHC